MTWLPLVTKAKCSLRSSINIWLWFLSFLFFLIKKIFFFHFTYQLQFLLPSSSPPTIFPHLPPVPLWSHSIHSSEPELALTTLIVLKEFTTPSKGWKQMQSSPAQHWADCFWREQREQRVAISAPLQSLSRKLAFTFLKITIFFSSRYTKHFPFIAHRECCTFSPHFSRAAS